MRRRPSFLSYLKRKNRGEGISARSCFRSFGETSFWIIITPTPSGARAPVDSRSSGGLRHCPCTRDGFCFAPGVLDHLRCNFGLAGWTPISSGIGEGDSGLPDKTTQMPSYVTCHQSFCCSSVHRTPAPILASLKLRRTLQSWSKPEKRPRWTIAFQNVNL